MRKQIFIVIGVLFVAASVNAATLSMRWRDTVGDKIFMIPSSTAVVEVVVEDMQVGDTLQGAFFSLESLILDPITHVSNDTDVPNWSADNVFTGFPLGPSVFLVGVDTVTDFLTGPGTVVIGTFVIHFEDTGAPIFGSEFEITFDHAANHGLVDMDGGFYQFGISGAAAGYSGYYSFGKGSPGVTQMSDSLPRDPLIVTYFPEPGSLGLVTLGGLAVFMRRR